MNAIPIVMNVNSELNVINDSCDMTINGELYVIEQLIKDGMTVFDIGANIGEWSSYVLKTSPAVALFAFEPNATTFVSLQKRLSSHYKRH